MGDRKYVFYGEPLVPEAIDPIRNCIWRNKPDGGLWASPENAKFGWKEWAQQEEYCDVTKQTKTVFTLEGANILHWYYPEDVMVHPENKDVRGCGIPVGRHYIPDFERIAQEYDAIECHMSEGNGLYSFLYGWDCDSILVLNPDVIRIKTIEELASDE